MFVACIVSLMAYFAGLSVYLFKSVKNSLLKLAIFWLPQFRALLEKLLIKCVESSKLMTCEM